MPEENITSPLRYSHSLKFKTNFHGMDRNFPCTKLIYIFLKAFSQIFCWKIIIFFQNYIQDIQNMLLYFSNEFGKNWQAGTFMVFNWNLQFHLQLLQSIIK